MNEKAYKFSVRDDTTFRAGGSGGGSSAAVVNITNTGNNTADLGTACLIVTEPDTGLEMFGYGPIIIPEQDTWMLKFPLINGAAIVGIENGVTIESVSENIEIITVGYDGLVGTFLIITGDGDISFSGQSGGPK